MWTNVTGQRPSHIILPLVLPSVGHLITTCIVKCRSHHYHLYCQVSVTSLPLLPSVGHLITTCIVKCRSHHYHLYCQVSVTSLPLVLPSAGHIITTCIAECIATSLPLVLSSAGHIITTCIGKCWSHQRIGSKFSAVMPTILIIFWIALDKTIFLSSHSWNFAPAWGNKSITIDFSINGLCTDPNTVQN